MIDEVILFPSTLVTADDNTQVEIDVTDSDGDIDVYCDMTANVGGRAFTFIIYGRNYGSANEISLLTPAAISTVGLKHLGKIPKNTQLLRVAWTQDSAGTSATFEIKGIYSKRD